MSNIPLECFLNIEPFEKIEKNRNISLSSTDSGRNNYSNEQIRIDFRSHPATTKKQYDSSVNQNIFTLLQRYIDTPISTVCSNDIVILCHLSLTNNICDRVTNEQRW